MSTVLDTPGLDAPGDFGHVAIIGMAGRFPGAPDVETFWADLAAGREGIARLSADELREAGVDPELLKRENYVPAKGVLDDADLFDAGFFGYHPREAEVLDPQHRVFLECVWEALESAGCDPYAFTGRIGVFAGASLNSYLLFNLMANERALDAAGAHQTLIASDKDFLATRVSYKLNLRGPSLTVQTACSTSLTAVHLACQSLINGECDIAVAGGVSVSVPLKNGYLYEQGGILSPDGHCRPFDADAGGTVAGNGAGAVVLRNLGDARAAGDVVRAVIRGSAMNNDGSLKVGYTAPSVDGQAEVIAEALAVADIDADSVGYVETHGTGTALGDPIEITALTQAFRRYTDSTGFCAIGSVKSNVGHLDAAAGVTGLIKAVLVLEREAIPATLNQSRPNPELALPSTPFFVNAELRPWPRSETPRRAGVSSFGIGGSNVHVILEEAPDEAVPDGPSGTASSGPRLLPLSAKSPAALAGNARRLADHLERHPELDLDDVAFTLAHRRRAFEQRATVTCREPADAVAALRRIGEDAATAAGRDVPVAFLFPGQGAQYVGMARDLYDGEPEFAAELDRCAELFTPHLGRDPRALLFGAPDDPDTVAELTRTELTQPVLFMVEYALARLWESLGVRPKAMVGHSVGEYVAACLAGVFSLEDAVRLVAVRGRLVQTMPSGSMLAVFLPERETADWLTAELDLAAVNSTGLCVVSGPADAVDDLQRRLTSAGVTCRRLHTSHAFHSASMADAVAPFVEEVRSVRLNAPRLPFCSNLTGTWITDEQATSPEYWGRHLRETVRFADSLDVLLADDALVLLEVGPGRTLGDFAGRHRAWSARRTVISSLRHPKERRDDREHLLDALGGLWSAGVAVDWSALVGGASRRPLRLPTYAFQRQRYWVRPDRPASGPAPARPAAVTSLDDWFYTLGFRRLAPGTGGADLTGATWVVLGTGLPLGAELADRLAADGASVLRVDAGDELRQDEGGSWTLDPTRRDHFAALVKSVEARGPRVIRVVHLLGLAGEPAEPAEPGERPYEARLGAARRLGFDSLLALAQGIGDVSPAGPVEIDVLCRGVFAVTGDEPLRPENALVLGAATVIPQEVSRAGCRILDVTGADTPSGHERAAHAVHELLGHPIGERELALRGRHWWARDFDQVKLTGDAGPSRLRDNGVYLITGGLGGVGLALAEHIAGAVEAPVLGLLGRSEFPAEPDWAGWLREHGDEDPTSRRIHRLRRLRERGAQVVLLRADVTDREQTVTAVTELRRRHGSLHGVVHAAGLPSGGLIAHRSAEDAAAVLAVKTVGTLVLDEACAGDDLDFLLLCSSLTAVLGGPGQSDYCAANAFLDAYAQWKRTVSGTPVSAVAWDTWRGVGMAAGLVERLSGGGRATGHPLLDRLVRATDTSRTYSTTLTTRQSWIVDEHRIMGHGLVPGTTYLELVHAAVAEQAAGRVVELHDVLFTMPVIVPDDQSRELFTTVEQRDGQVRFTVRSRADGGAWQEHAGGLVSFHERAAETVRDLDQVRAECAVTEVIDTEEELKRRLRLDKVEKGGRIEFSFGPRWRCLERIEVGERGLLVTLRLDDAFADDLDGYALHPALLDVAGASARIHARDIYYLPFTYRSLRVWSGLTATVYCHVRLAELGSGETLTCSLDMFASDGRLLAQIVDFSIKRINDVDGMLAQIARSAAAPVAAATATEPTPAAGVVAQLAEGMSAQEGTEVFARLLAAPALPGQVVVAHRDLAELRRLARSITPELLIGEMAQLAPLESTHPRPELATPYVAPETDEQRAVAAIWQEVLGLDRVGLDDDFFALGGHSLAAVQIGAKIRGEFGVELDLRSFFDGPTVAHTVTALHRAQSGTDDDRIEAVSRDEPGDLDGLAELSDEEVEAQLRELLAAEAGEDPA